MAAIVLPTYSLSDKLQLAIERVYRLQFARDLSDPDLPKAIAQTHEFYIEQPEARSPWSKLWFQKAYLAFYLPRNYLRYQGVLQRLSALESFTQLRQLTDWGSGNGAFAFAARERFPGLQIKCVELCKEAREQHRLLGAEEIDFVTEDFQSQALVMSYSLTEQQGLPEFVKKFDRVLLLEPSTHQDGRRLLGLREQLLADSYQALAPCTHQGRCPLLHHSAGDWCHDSFSVQYPDYLKRIEPQLPMRLGDLSVSYLYMSRREKNPFQGKLRVVGNPLVERGKRKQLICRGEEREFLSWFTKRQTVPDFYRGDLLELEEEPEKRANELRSSSPRRL